MNFKNEFALAKKTALQVGDFLKLQTVKKINSQDEKDIKFWDVAAGIAINCAINNLYDIKFLKDYLTVTKVSI